MLHVHSMYNSRVCTHSGDLTFNRVHHQSASEVNVFPLANILSSSKEMENFKLIMMLNEKLGITNRTTKTKKMNDCIIFNRNLPTVEFQCRSDKY